MNTVQVTLTKKINRLQEAMAAMITGAGVGGQAPRECEATPQARVPKRAMQGAQGQREVSPKTQAKKSPSPAQLLERLRSSPEGETLLRQLYNNDEEMAVHGGAEDDDMDDFGMETDEMTEAQAIALRFQ